MRIAPASLKKVRPINSEIVGKNACFGPLEKLAFASGTVVAKEIVEQRGCGGKVATQSS